MFFFFGQKKGGSPVVANFFRFSKALLEVLHAPSGNIVSGVMDV